MNPLHYNFNDFIYVDRTDGKKSKRYRHWCLSCAKERGYAYKNKILKEPYCHSCKMKQSTTLAKISINSSKLKHSQESKDKISKALYVRYGGNPINTKLARNLRSRFNKALASSAKSGSAVNDLGCSISDFKIHIESKFTDGMTWENYGKNGWHIDHIIPLCKFDLQDEVQLKKACNYTNLQPLWCADNLAKRKTDGTFK